MRTSPGLPHLWPARCGWSREVSRALENPGSGVPGTWCRDPAVLSAGVPKYPIPQPHPYPKHPVSFPCIKEPQIPLTFGAYWELISASPSLGPVWGGPNSITKRHSLSVGNPNHPLLRSPRPSQRFEPEEGAWEPADHCCPERPPGSSQGDSKAGCWVTSLLPRQREGLTHRHEVRAVPGTQDGGSPLPARVLRAACDPCVCGGSSLRV